MSVWPFLAVEEHWSDLVLFVLSVLFMMNQSFLSYKDVGYG